MPREQWGQDLVGQAMVPLQRLHAVSPGQSLNDVLPLLANNDLNQVPVVQNGSVVGLLDRARIMQYMEVRRDLGTHSANGQPVAPDAKPRDRDEHFGRPVAGAS
jgi:predicted transcriptional regulator